MFFVQPQLRHTSVRWTLVLALVGSFGSGCSNETVYAAYQGADAFPNTRPQLLTEGRRLGYISDSLSDSVSVVDMDSLELVGQAPVGRDPVDTDGPHHLAVDPERRVLYVALSYPALGLTGPHAGHGGGERLGYVQMLSLEDLRPLGEVRVERSPGDIVLSPDRHTLAVSHYDLLLAESGTTVEGKRAALIMMDSPELMDGSRPSIQKEPLCITPHGMNFSPDSSRLYIACAGEDTIAVVDRPSGDILERVPVANAIGAPGAPVHQPYAVEVSPEGSLLLVSNIGSNRVTLFDVDASQATGSLQQRVTIPLSGAAYFPAFSPTRNEVIVPVQNPDGAARIDLASGRLLEQVSYPEGDCKGPHEARFAADGRAFLVCEGNRVDPGTIAEIDPVSLQVLGSVSVGVYPDRLFIVEP